MKKIITTITINPEVKKQAIAILKSDGKKLSSIIEIYLKKIIEENKSGRN